MVRLARLDNDREYSPAGAESLQTTGAQMSCCAVQVSVCDTHLCFVHGCFKLLPEEACRYVLKLNYGTRFAICMMASSLSLGFLLFFLESAFELHT